VKSVRPVTSKALLLASLSGLAGLVLAPAPARAFESTYLYNLATTTGNIRSSGLLLAFDDKTKEVFVVGGNQVRIFNETGMETFSFGAEANSGSLVGLAPTETGDLLLLTTYGDRCAVLRANFRGEVVGEVVLKNLPPELAEFRFNALGYARGRIYLADLGAMRLLVVDAEGNYVTFHDLAVMLEVAEKRGDFGIRGFRVAPNGDVLFTVQALFKAYVLSPDGNLRAFGKRGSAPGKFNVITGIAADEQGHYYVADILKSAVLVFDKDFNWLKEFGYRGGRPGNLVSPVDLVVGDGKLYVSQFARRGVAVFKVSDPRQGQ
jgi:hypothetical protein